MATGTCKVLNVAEKNDAARALSNIMARGAASRVTLNMNFACEQLHNDFFFSSHLHRLPKRESFSKYNKIYEFNFNIFGKVKMCENDLLSY